MRHPMWRGWTVFFRKAVKTTRAIPAAPLCKSLALFHRPGQHWVCLHCVCRPAMDGRSSGHLHKKKVAKMFSNGAQGGPMSSPHVVQWGCCRREICVRSFLGHFEAEVCVCISFCYLDAGGNGMHVRAGVRVRCGVWLFDAVTNCKTFDTGFPHQTGCTPTKMRHFGPLPQ